MVLAFAAVEKARANGASILNFHAALTANFIPLSQAAIAEVGPAAQSLGGIYAECDRETFVPKSALALNARVPKRTYWRHCPILKEKQWIETMGRQKLKSGWLRRTSTVRLTKKAVEQKAPFLRLPWWAPCKLGAAKGIRQLRWSSLVVLAFVASEYNKLWSAYCKGQFDDCFGDADDPETPIILLAEMEDRFRFGLDRLTASTGLSRNSIIAAKRELSALNLVRWAWRHDENGGNDRDLLAPHNEFVLVSESRPNNMVALSIGRVPDSTGCNSGA